jgi:hypothetical protein
VAGQHHERDARLRSGPALHRRVSVSPRILRSSARRSRSVPTTKTSNAERPTRPNMRSGTSVSRSRTSGARLTCSRPLTSARMAWMAGCRLRFAPARPRRATHCTRHDGPPRSRGAREPLHQGSRHRTRYVGDRGRDLRRGPGRRHATLLAYDDHGTVGEPLPAVGAVPTPHWPSSNRSGVDVAALAAGQQADGARSFVHAWKRRLRRIADQLAEATLPARPQRTASS